MLRFNLQLLSKYKSSLMGIATIMILLTHAPAYDIVLPYNLNSLLGACQVGVMIFFFLSGVGLYYSLEQNKLENISSLFTWYKKRLVRLLFPYLIIYGSAHAILCLENDWNIFRYVFDISTISFWFGHSTCWFVNVILLLYILVPLWYKLLKALDHPVIPTILIFVMLVFSGNGYFIQASVFFVGFWLAKYIRKEYVLTTKGLSFIFLLVFLALTLYYCFNFGYLLLILIWPLLIILCIILDTIRSNKLLKGLQFFGNISLESYLFNTTLYIWLDTYNLIPNSIYEYRYLLIIIIGTFLSYCVNKISKIVISKLI